MLQLKRARTRHEWPRLLVLIAMLVAQVAMAISPLGEARRGIGADAHVEERGASRHYAHAEANCAFCAVRTIHAPAAVAIDAFLAANAHEACCILGDVAVTSRMAPSSHLSRAPPALS
jgi:hypothetical protein